MVTMKDVINATCNTEEEAKLFRAVVRQFGDWKLMFEYPEDYRDAGAGVSGFIYYTDTLAFFKRQSYNILTTLSRFNAECGCQLEKDVCWEAETTFQNWLSWFALENTVQKVIDYK